MRHYVTGSDFDWDSWFDRLDRKNQYNPVVYFLYNSRGVLLYIGKTTEFFTRMAHHKQRFFWDQVEMIGVRIYPEISEMDIAELYWIQQMRPKYNLKDNHRGTLQTLEIHDSSDEWVFQKEELMIRRKERQKNKKRQKTFWTG